MSIDTPEAVRIDIVMVLVNSYHRTGRDRLDELADIGVPTIPDCEVQMYEGVGHVLMEERPERTARDVQAFLFNG